MTFKQLVILTCLLFASLIARVYAVTPAMLSPDASCELEHQNAQCYTVITSEEANGSGAEVRIPVRYLPALGKRRVAAPIVWLNGGPGISNMNPPLPDWMFEHFDVLVIGYRGIDGTPLLDCPNLKTEMARVQKDHSIRFLSDQALTLWRSEVSACQQHWEAQGYNTQAYSTLHVVNDIEHVRQALALPQISLVSASYGTRIAWYYDQLHPGKVFRNLLLSGNPTGGFYFEPETLDAQLIQLSRWCRQDEHCRAMTPDLYASINQVLRNPPASAWGVHIDPDHLRITTFMLLYSRNTWPLLADAFAKAERGNSSGLAAMLKFPNPMTGNDWVWGTFFSAGAIDYDPERDYAADLAASQSRNALGSPLSELIFKGLSPGWSKGSITAPVQRESDTHTLILGSEVDVATPVERIEQLWLPWLSNGALISVRGAGHAPDHIIAGGAQLATHLESFLSGGSAMSDQAFGEAIVWKPKFSLSWIVYAVWGALGIFMAMVLYVSITFFIRKLR